MKKALEKIVNDRFGILVFSLAVSGMFKIAVNGIEYLFYLRSFNKGRNLYYNAYKLVDNDLKPYANEPSPSEFHNGTYKSSNENEEKEEESMDEDDRNNG